ncbi:hypothetical protein ROZALSC1DRAFT_27673 [Rozella allomycis CSF55]|uniref:PATROL1-like C-terminal domain-containing protein n=1 Tax=Rozella allomycis (strain CSF55) TaxID=988480 RepID=A0A4P9YMU9_ROZAC|nr:hypothetical protein ROZALSC1DRAFT_27673 [Rozella allomycis CSF55]
MLETTLKGIAEEYLEDSNLIDNIFIDVDGWIRPLIKNWMNEIPQALNSTMKRCLDLDKEFHPIEKEKVFYSSSIMDLFAFINSRFVFFTSFPSDKIKSEYSSYFISNLVKSIEKYFEIVNSSIGRQLKENELDPFDHMEITMEIFDKTILKKKKYELLPMNDMIKRILNLQSRTKLLVMINNAIYAKEKLIEFESRVKFYLPSTLVISNLQNHLQSLIDSYIQYFGIKVVYCDIKSSFIENLYIPNASVSNLVRIGNQVLDPILNDIVSGMPFDYVNLIVHSFFLTLVRVYEKILLGATRKRKYYPNNTEIILEDIDYLENLFSRKDSTSFGLSPDCNFIL